MTPSPTPSPFVGCWQTQWSVCNTGDTYAAGAHLAIKSDVANPSQLIGAWGGGPDALSGAQHGGFLMGKLNKTGTVLSGTWYEIIYKDSATCPTLSYTGTFSFRLDAKKPDAFTGSWTDKDGPNKGCKHTMRWDGKRA